MAVHILVSLKIDLEHRRLLGDVGILATTAGLTFLVNNYVVSEKEMKQYTGHLAGLLASSLFYPFQVVCWPASIQVKVLYR